MSSLFCNHVNFLETFLFRAKATLLDPATGKSSPKRKSPSPPRETTIPTVTTKDMEEESAKAASPRHEDQDVTPPPIFSKDSPHTAISVDEEVVILGSQKITQNEPSNTLSKIPEVEVKDEKLNRGKDAVSLSNLPDFKAMDFSSMMTEFLTRSSQHRVMEDNFMTTLQECYEVRLPCLLYLNLQHIYAVAPKL